MLTVVLALIFAAGISAEGTGRSLKFFDQILGASNPFTQTSEGNTAYTDSEDANSGNTAEFGSLTNILGSAPGQFGLGLGQDADDNEATAEGPGDANSGNEAETGDILTSTFGFQQDAESNEAETDDGDANSGNTATSADHGNANSGNVLDFGNLFGRKLQMYDDDDRVFPGK
eukprot:TRINITY_DN9851_c1_g1_i2.p3 TRINITY_DN9851_c1_g1~~TRINITY_DN9851_c1_g1_i2.p3  ORF type:complete len:173 (-),score=37.59 TRINITY_DN9851_c1_g1_i2:485-1003(-)